MKHFLQNESGAVGIIIIMLVIIAAGFGGWQWYQKQRDANPMMGEDVPVTLNVYFDNRDRNPGAQDCGAVYPVSRQVSSLNLATELLGELFRGPTPAEKARGYTSLFSESTSDILLNVRVAGGFAYVNLKDIRYRLSSVSASCGGAQFFAEVERTLKQIPGVHTVIYALEGDPEAFYEWTQLGCDGSGRCDSTPFQLE